MQLFRLIKDSRGTPSWHFTLGIIWTTLFSFKALVSGIDVHHTVLGGFTLASFPGSEYFLYITPWLSAMGVREWIEKAKGDSNAGSAT